MDMNDGCYVFLAMMQKEVMVPQYVYITQIMGQSCEEMVMVAHCQWPECPHLHSAYNENATVAN